MAEHPSLLVLPDDTAWPNPAAAGDLEWRLRYGNPSRGDILFAATVIDAYLALIEKPVRRREEVVRLIRAAVAQAGGDSDG